MPCRYKRYHPDGHALTRGSVVALLAPNSMAWVVADLACQANALVSAPLEARDASELGPLLRILAPVIVVCSSAWTLPIIQVPNFTFLEFCFKHYFTFL